MHLRQLDARCERFSTGCLQSVGLGPAVLHGRAWAFRWNSTADPSALLGNPSP